MSPLVFAILFALVCVGAFLVGLRFFRMAEPPGGASIEQVRRFGRLLMMASSAPLKACAYSSWWILRIAVLLRGSKTATRRRPGYCASTAAIVSRTAVG